MSRTPRHSGGCQCGAVRYACYGELSGAHICHCRMCQKAFGSFFAPLVHVDRADFAWTRGEPGWFRSSDDVRRGFCRDCGTPLLMDDVSEPHINLGIGSLDHPAGAPPHVQFGNEGKMPWFDTLPDLPGGTTTEHDMGPERMARLVSRQHPDHDTTDWPPKE